MVRIAQLGVGYWGPNLLRNLYSNPRCKLTCVVDPSPERRAFVSKNYPGIETWETAEQAIDNRAVDAIVIATPAATHFKIAMRCLHTGKHVLVEKPLATAVAEVDQMGEVANGKNLVVMAAHTFIYNDAVWVLDLLDQRLKMRVMRQPLSVFTETVSNLSLQDKAGAERERLGERASKSVRMGRWLIVVVYRLKRFFGGAYWIRPHTYCIYTAASPHEREGFIVEKPTYRWVIQPKGR
ncbi:MAG: Gfo/Idh/MocA family oxidoreductase [Proteobacteria bacterium]|nr:Gfo/Idh/MocA family oxidoreductase [Pseudomonadota bacterium]